MIEFGQKLVEGLGAAGWAIGLMLGLGAFLLVAGTICYVMLSVFGGEEEEGEK